MTTTMPLKPPQPLQQILAADDIIPTIQRVLAAQTAVRDAVTSTVAPADARYANVIAPLQAVDDANQGATGVFTMLRYSGPDAATRAAVEEAAGLWAAAGAERLKRRDVYELVRAVRERGEVLGYEERSVLEDVWLEFRHAGHGVLGEEGIGAYLARRERIEGLKREFHKNLRGEVGGLWFEAGELEGVPRQEVAGWKGEDGKVFVPLERAACDAILRHADDAETRRRFYVAYDNRLEENVPVYKEMLILRDENARLLGYRSHADFRVTMRTAPSTEWVERFLLRLSEELMPQGRREMARLREKKRAHLGGGGEEEIMPWDYDYYTRLLQEEADVDHELVSEYFPLRHTLSSMLGLFREFLGLEFVPVPEEDLVGKLWAEEVEVWGVWEGRGERKGEFVGYLYADVLWREGKYRGNCNVNLQCGYVNGDGTRVYPATILMCSFQPPTASSCALLKHREVVTLFHELGHGLHDLLCRTSHTRFHGTRVKPDFGEAPSTMLENWCWMPRELAAMSLHYTRADPAYMARWREEHAGAEVPPEKIPEELVGRLAESRELNRALWFLRQLLFARFDLQVNNQASTDAVRELDEVKLYNDIQDELTLRPNPDRRGFGHVQSSHLISLHDAGYYSYLSAQAFAADFFESTFAEDPRNAEAWDRYRRGILEYGGSKKEMDIMTEFLGREPGPGALLRSLGLDTKDGE
ncbi:hypothetical protein CkaCkLH20_08984 [Colletotrichum karsti]|uniref:Peptidase M3A/M3B catalytic domain-containing protein n=1 Tax=Colletotrichum karsti TaxID=1095194 RepID=A0A9P6LIB9_9PEZI|nr:uncharacterized protein CkaCkLH20_08984 [Colletotrichum karsti]KAF9873525.1 hypothetical protein CkaCkLH20_08984 [Colletotrichum karsti]